MKNSSSSSSWPAPHSEPPARLAGARALYLVYDDVPPSLNRVGTRGHWRHAHGQKKRWQKIMSDLLIEAQMPRGQASRVRANATLRFPVRRPERDEGNFRVWLEKALGDALVCTTPKNVRPVPTELRYLPSDDRNHYRFGACRFDPEPGPKRTIVRLRWWPQPL